MHYYGMVETCTDMAKVDTCVDMAWWIQAWVYSKGGYWLWGSFINQKRTLPREVFMQAKGKKMRQYEETKVAKGVRIKEQIKK